MLELPLPPVKQTLSAGLEFPGLVDYLTVDVSLFDVLHVAVAEVGSVQFIFSHRAVVKFSSQAVFTDFVQPYDGQTFTIAGESGTVAVSDRSVLMTYVSVHGAPLEFP